MPFLVAVRPCPLVKVQNAWSEASQRCGSALPRPDPWGFPADQCRGALPAWQPSSAAVGIGQGHGCSVAGCGLALARSSKLAPARAMAVRTSGP